MPELCRPRTRLAIGGAVGPLLGGHGWRLAFFVSLLPGLAVAALCWKLPEPRRGTADRAHVTRSDGMELADDTRVPLFPTDSGASGLTWWTGCGGT